jgi:endonuclease YncB( thermonuclease family)
MYEYRATLIRVIDGDSLHATLDLGLDIRHDVTLRLAHINTPELNDKDASVRAKALEARKFLIDRLPIGVNALTIRTIKDRQEKYGRYLAEIVSADGTTTVNEQLLNAGLAVPYEG